MFTTVYFAPLMLFGWQLVSAATNVQFVSALLLIVATAAVARLALREFPGK